MGSPGLTGSRCLTTLGDPMETPEEAETPETGVTAVSYEQLCLEGYRKRVIPPMKR